jgi:hypothetical protein
MVRVDSGGGLVRNLLWLAGNPFCADQARLEGIVIYCATIFISEELSENGNWLDATTIQLMVVRKFDVGIVLG